MQRFPAKPSRKAKAEPQKPTAVDYFPKKVSFEKIDLQETTAY